MGAREYIETGMCCAVPRETLENLESGFGSQIFAEPKTIDKFEVFKVVVSRHVRLVLWQAT